MEVRNFLFDTGVIPSSKFDIKVVSVGNLEMGGTGKTPFIKYLIKLLSPQYSVAVLSRGYGRSTKGFRNVSLTNLPLEVGDEPLEIKKDFVDIPVCVCENRVLGASELIALYPDVDLILLDDAFQHRSIHRDVNILLSRANRPFYSDYVIPTGRLREFAHNRKRADAIIFTSAQSTFIPRIKGDNVFLSGTKYSPLITVNGADQDVTTSFGLITGLANPQKMEDEVGQMVKLDHICHFGDHHRYTPNEIEKLVVANPVTTWITTHKDWVKLEQIFRESFPKTVVMVLKIETVFYDQAFSDWVLSKLKNG